MNIRKLAALLSLAAIAGTVALPSPDVASAAETTSVSTFSYSSSRANKLFTVAKKYLGTPYEFGSNRNNTKTFDCSDFVRHVYKEALGITLPSTSATQATYVKKKGATTTNWRNLKPGDLMFFMSYKGTSASAYKGIDKSKQRITHVAIYMGNGKMIHTYSKQSGGVRIDSIAGKHWEYRFVFGGTAM
ncbi:C40 family peptidase [Paenibacillus thermoaerophilus]|jgi:cell wall-associated NlpC family hydrolase|uniref:C40 family peptidase n=1 Tax=Paenibacillus thermoaerophilus TaxID=1215385 RepID=A0ABW2V3M5_9BACL|nr:C40 family peptidase [Paenibacillus thermoaerophilus]TMV18548.1 NlpC/P60 family protein [Paenibacillus thermoaerophilus]